MAASAAGAAGQPSTTEAPCLPSLAVVIPCLNGAPWIAETIRSVLDQNYQNLEVVVVDDGSSDDSLPVIKSFGDKIQWRSGPNRGACAARNTGLSLVTADFTTFIDADDRMNDGFLAAAGRALAGKDQDMFILPLIVRGKEKLFLFDNFPKPQSDEDWLVKFIEAAPQTAQMIWSTRFLRSVGGWNEAVALGQDVELGIRAVLARPRIQPLRNLFAFYNWHEDPRRLMFQNRLARVTAELESVERLEPRILAFGGERVRNALARRYYELASLAFNEEGGASAGRSTLGRARRLGLKGHPGTLPHRVVASLVGLEAKQRISGAVRRLRSTARPGAE
jgi:glycosyltransferase involved in cell wall biosynthesis